MLGLNQKVIELANITKDYGEDVTLENTYKR